MNLHEYQGKEILNSFSVRLKLIIASSSEEAVAAAENFPMTPVRPGGLLKPRSMQEVEAKEAVLS